MEREDDLPLDGVLALNDGILDTDGMARLALSASVEPEEELLWDEVVEADVWEECLESMDQLDMSSDLGLAVFIWSRLSSVVMRLGTAERSGSERLIVS